MTDPGLEAFLTAPRRKRTARELLETLFMLTRGCVERHKAELHDEVRTEVLIALEMAEAALRRQR